MPHNERIKPQGCLNTVALVLASITFSMGLWACFGLAIGMIEPYQVPEPVCGEPGTDWYWECKTGSELDLSPTYEDEAHTTEGERA